MTTTINDFDRWSKHSSAKKPDHWSKIKMDKTFRIQQLPTGLLTVLCSPAGPPLAQHQKRNRRHTVDLGELRTLSRTGNKSLNQQLMMTVPSLTQSYSQTQHSQISSRKWTRVQSASYQRARSGFKFWTEDKLRPATPSLKNTLGSGGSFLGLGIPRL